MDAADNGEHLEEGTIHAWLDDALDATEAARVSSHVASCARCAAAVAEARGLIAGASRVVRALDDDVTAAAAPTPAWGVAAPAAIAPRARWSTLRVTRSRAAIAASLIVALGITLTYPRSAREPAPMLVQTPTTSSSAPASAVAGDGLLDSAIKRNVAQAQPPRAMEAASSPAVPQAPPPAAGNVAAFSTDATARVAEGRASAQALADTSAPAADKVRAPDYAPVKKDVVVADASVPDGGVVARKTVRREAPAAQIPAATSVDERADRAAAECYRVESPVSNATFGPQRLPFTVTLRPTNGAASGLGLIAGAMNRDSSNASLTWSRQAGDTLTFRLRRIGYTGEVTLAAGDESRKGTMTSAPLTAHLEEVVTTGMSVRTDSAPGNLTRRRAARKEADAPTTKAEAPAAIPVVARRIRCEP